MNAISNVRSVAPTRNYRFITGIIEPTEKNARKTWRFYADVVIAVSTSRGSALR